LNRLVAQLLLLLFTYWTSWLAAGEARLQDGISWQEECQKFKAAYGKDQAMNIKISPGPTLEQRPEVWEVRWSYPVISAAAITVMLSTLITILDGYPSVVEALTNELILDAAGMLYLSRRFT